MMKYDACANLSKITAKIDIPRLGWMNLDLKDAQEYPSKTSRNAIGRDGIHTILKMVMFKYNYYSNSTLLFGKPT